MGSRTVNGGRGIQLALALMVLIWGTNSSIVKVALTELAPLTIASLRVTIATAVLLAWMRVREGRLPRLDARGAGLMAVLGLTGVALNQLLFVTGLHRTVPSHSSLMISISPIFALVLTAIFLDEPIGFRKVVGILISFAGVLALTLRPDFTIDHTHIAGDLLTLASTSSFAIYMVVGKGAVRRYGALMTTAYSHLFGALLLVPAALIARVPTPAPLSARGVLAVLYMAIFASAIAYLIFYRGLEEVGVTRMAALSYFQPLLAILISLALGQEHLTPQIVYGGAMILTGVFIAERF